MAIKKQRKKSSKSKPTQSMAKKTGSVKAQSVDTVNRPRRGRPVSVEALKRKLETQQTQLNNEKQKRRDQLHNAQLKIGTLTAERRTLRQELSQVRRRLQQIESDQKRAARYEIQQRRIEEARNLAVARFLQKWDKQHKSAVSAAGGKKRKPGRPRKA